MGSSPLFLSLPIKSAYANDGASGELHMKLVPLNYIVLTKITIGASLISIPAIHALDPLCFILGEFESLNATSNITFPNIQFIREDGTKTEPEKRNFADTVGIQGILRGGTFVSFSLNITTDGTPAHFEWVIAGEKGSLKFVGPAIFIGMGTPTLYQYTPGEGKDWEKVEFASTSYGGIGELYARFVEGGKNTYVDFDEAVKRHRMVEAIERSAAKGTRESY